MHETLIEKVKGHTDKNDTVSDIKIAEGWCFHEVNGNIALRLKYVKDDEEIYSTDMVTRIPRTDVVGLYKRDDIDNCGWRFEICCYHFEFLELQANIDGEWVMLADFTIYRTSSKYIPSYIVVDNFYKSPDKIRDLALKQQFDFHPNNHKGKRTDQLFRFPYLKERFEGIIGGKIKNWDSYGVNGCFQHCVAGDQIVIHSDGQQYAGIIYLTPDAPPNCGTTFYRSKHTKKNKYSYEDASIVFKHGFYDTTEFDVVDTVGNVYNRLILFDAKMIHSAACYFGNDINNSRLFQMFFFDLE